MINRSNIINLVNAIGHPDIGDITAFIAKIKICFKQYERNDFFDELVGIIANFDMDTLIEVGTIIIDENDEELTNFLFRILTEDSRICNWMETYIGGQMPGNVAAFLIKLVTSLSMRVATICECNANTCASTLCCMRQGLLDYLDSLETLNPTETLQKAKLERLLA